MLLQSLPDDLACDILVDGGCVSVCGEVGGGGGKLHDRSCSATFRMSVERLVKHTWLGTIRGVPSGQLSNPPNDAFCRELLACRNIV